MNYDSVDEVYAVNNAVRRDLVARVEGLGEAQVNASEGGWTVAQIVEHLSIVEPRITGAIERMLAAKDGDDRERKLFAPFSLDEYLEQARGKIEAPESLHPTGLPLADRDAVMHRPPWAFASNREGSLTCRRVSIR